MLTPKLTAAQPTLIVVDNFFADPMAVRRFALEQEFAEHPEYHKGRRSKAFSFPGIRERFEGLLGFKIANFGKHPTCATFQICLGGDQLVYHSDGQEWAGIVYLT